METRTLSKHIPNKILPFLLSISIQIYLPVFGLLGLLAVLSQRFNFQVSTLVQDPASLTGAPPYYGFFSNLGVLFWASTAAICFFSAYLINAATRQPKIAVFLFWSGCITTVLLIDDLFMLHDSILYVLFHINENILFAVYIGIVAVYLARFLPVILQTKYYTLVAALGLFVFSMSFDKLIGVSERFGLPITMNQNLNDLFEEGTKFFAISTWFVYYAQTSSAQLLALLEG